MWVAESFGSNATNRLAVDSAYSASPNSTISAGGQKIAFAPVKKGGDTVSTTTALTMAGTASTTSSTPKLATASVELPAVQQLSPVGDVVIQYAQTYLGNGFGGAANSGDVWAELTGLTPNLAFGGTGAGSDKAGGFLQPNMAIKGLSRISGTVGDVAGAATQTFDPAQFLASGIDLPKLFGVVELLDLIELVVGDLDRAPSIVSEALDRIEGFIADLERAKKMVGDAVVEAQKLVDRATGKAAELQTQAAQALTAAQNLQGTIESAVDDILDQIAALPGAAEAAVQAALANPLQALKTATTEMEQVAPLLPPLIRQQLLNLAKILSTIADAVDIVTDIFRFLNGFGTSAVMASFRFEWKPPMKSWPDANDPILALQEDSLVLAVEGRVSGKGEMGIEVLAELRDFVLHLLPAAPLVRFKFDHLAFRAGSSGKPEVDVVLQDIEFVGILSFVEILKELIPFDGFSDPPFLEIDASGLTAGFTLDLPNVAIGVFNLSNMSLGADIQVPFLGKSVTVGFNFCTGERPITLTVMAIGGGGWFMIRLAPDGLDVLELGLEAGAALAVDFGVASGSISAMIGIYMRLEGEAGSLTGYFRLRGEVDVLGLISASIELYLELVYEFDSGKMIGLPRLDRQGRGAVLLRLGHHRMRAALRRLQRRPELPRHHGAGTQRLLTRLVGILPRLRRSVEPWSWNDSKRLLSPRPTWTGPPSMCPCSSGRTSLPTVPKGCSTISSTFRTGRPFSAAAARRSNFATRTAPSRWFPFSIRSQPRSGMRSFHLTRRCGGGKLLISPTGSGGRSVPQCRTTAPNSCMSWRCSPTPPRHPCRAVTLSGFFSAD